MKFFIVTNYSRVPSLLSIGYPWVLFSYWAFRSLTHPGLRALLESDCEIMVDSGAYGAWSRGAEVDLQDYIRYCKQLKSIRGEKIRFVALDVIPGKFGRKPTREDVELAAQLSYENWLRMLDAGIDAIPVYHYNEPIDCLLRYVEQSQDGFIGLGSIARLGVRRAREMLAAVFRETHELVWRKKVRYHLFGRSSFELLHLFPLYSADASTAVLAAAMREIEDFCADYSRRRWEAGGAPPEVRTRLVLDVFCSNSVVAPHPGHKIFVYNALQYLRLAQFVTKLWEQRGICYDEPEGVSCEHC